MEDEYISRNYLMIVLLALTLILLFVLVLNGANNVSDESERNMVERPWQTPIDISKDEAEKIALEQANLDKLDSPVIPDNWETVVQSVYSVKYERDVLVYRVHIKTAELPPEEIMFNEFYYISADKGEVIISNN